MAELDLTNEFPFIVKEETPAQDGMQYAFSKGDECADNFEGSLISGAEVGGIMPPVNDDNVIYAEKGSLCEQSEPIVKYETDSVYDTSSTTADIGMFQVSLEQSSAQRDHESTKSAEKQMTAPETGNNLVATDLCAVLQNVPSLTGEVSSIPSVLSVFEGDATLGDFHGEHVRAQEDTEQGTDVAVLDTITELKKDEGLQERIRPEKLEDYVVEALPKEPEAIAYDERGCDANLSEEAGAVRKSHTRAAKSSRFRLTVNLQGKTGSMSSTEAAKERLACDHCLKTFKFNSGLLQHTLKFHSQSKQFQCDDCSMSFTTKALLISHILSHLGSKPATAKKNVKMLKCSQCSFTAKSNCTLKKHMLLHTVRKKRKCSQSQCKHGLKRRLNATPSSSMYVCQLCNYKTASIDSIRIHAVLHVASKASACIVCGTVLRKKTSLLEHLMGHVGDKQLTCKVCKTKFHSYHEYLLHLSSHRHTLLSGRQSKVASEWDLAACDMHGTDQETIPELQSMSKKQGAGAIETSAMEAKMSEVYTAGSRLMEMSKAVSFLADTSEVVTQLNEICAVVSQLALVSSSALLAFKNSRVSGTGRGRGRRAAAIAAAKLLSHKDEGDLQTKHIDNDDATDISFENGSLSTEVAATIKEELQDRTFEVPEDVAKQIQKNLNGQLATDKKKEGNILKPGSFLKLKYENGKKYFECTRCQKVFHDTGSLKRHVMVHDDIRPYACSKCSQSFRRREHLKKHMVTHSEDRPFKCSHCLYTAKTKQRLKIHTTSHLQSKPCACTTCSYTCRTQYELNQHMKKHQTRKCGQCDFVCHSRVDLNRHVSSHTTLSCRDCEFSTSDRAEYSKHIRKHSEFHPLCCEFCGYSCNTMKNFRYHMLRHENKFPFQCKDCDYKCSSRASFDCHRLKHAGLKPFLCSNCGASFRKSSHLNQHMLIHKDEKAYRCGRCG